MKSFKITQYKSGGMYNTSHLRVSYMALPLLLLVADLRLKKNLAMK